MEILPTIWKENTNAECVGHLSKKMGIIVHAVAGQQILDNNKKQLL
jgi:hypothetical protein